MRSIPRVYPCKLKINTACFLLCFKREQGLFLTSPGNFVGLQNHFQVVQLVQLVLYLKTEICIFLNILIFMRETSICVKNMYIKQLCSHRGCEFCYSLPGEETFKDLREMGLEVRAEGLVVLQMTRNQTKKCMIEFLGTQTWQGFFLSLFRICLKNKFFNNNIMFGADILKQKLSLTSQQAK